jgi:hypothetical protein
MKDILIPLGLLLFIVLFGYAIIHTGRKQRKAKSRVFRDFADKYGLQYQEIDDGKAQAFAKDFEGIGRFNSPSLGKVTPKDIVYGIMDGLEVIFFRHRIRFSEGWEREWFVSGVISAETIASRCAVQFCRGSEDKSTMYLQDPIVKERRVGPYNIVVRAASLSDAGKIVNESVLERLSGFSRDLSFRPEIQVRRNLLVTYLVDRNATVDNMETLENLFEFTRRVAGI